MKGITATPRWRKVISIETTVNIQALPNTATKQCALREGFFIVSKRRNPSGWYPLGFCQCATLGITGPRPEAMFLPCSAKAKEKGYSAMPSKKKDSDIRFVAFITTKDGKRIYARERGLKAFPIRIVRDRWKDSSAPRKAK